jgi:hypothetical protein
VELGQTGWSRGTRCATNDPYETDLNAVRVSPGGVLLDQQPFVIGTHLPNPNGSDDIDPMGPLQVVSNGADWFVVWQRHNPNLAGGIGMEWFATRVLPDGSVPDAQGTLLFSGNQYNDDFGPDLFPVRRRAIPQHARREQPGHHSPLRREPKLHRRQPADVARRSSSSALRSPADRTAGSSVGNTTTARGSRCRQRA